MLKSLEMLVDFHGVLDIIYLLIRPKSMMIPRPLMVFDYVKCYDSSSIDVHRHLPGPLRMFRSGWA